MMYIPNSSASLLRQQIIAMQTEGDSMNIKEMSKEELIYGIKKDGSENYRNKCEAELLARIKRGEQAKEAMEKMIKSYPVWDKMCNIMKQYKEGK